MTDDTRLRMGLVGAGPWAHKVHAPGIAAHPNTDLVAVWARRPDAAAEVARLGNATPVPTFGELLSTVDAVTFAVPPAVQAPLAREAVEAGKHVILEKPVAATVAEAEQLAAAAERAGVASLVVLTFRYAQETKDWLAGVHQHDDWAGGAARWFSGTLLSPKYEDSRWRHAGGALVDIGPHVFDLLDAALGPVTEVLSAHFAPPDLWHVLLGHDGGRVSAASLSMHTPAQAPITDFAVYGPQGHSVFDAAGSAPDRYAALLDDFVDQVRTGRAEHPLDVRRGLHIQRILHAITERLSPR